jgi:hypothetical protein
MIPKSGYRFWEKIMLHGERRVTILCGSGCAGAHDELLARDVPDGPSIRLDVVVFSYNRPGSGTCHV